MHLSFRRLQHARTRLPSGRARCGRAPHSGGGGKSRFGEANDDMSAARQVAAALAGEAAGPDDAMPASSEPLLMRCGDPLPAFSLMDDNWGGTSEKDRVLKPSVLEVWRSPRSSSVCCCNLAMWPSSWPWSEVMPSVDPFRCSLRKRLSCSFSRSTMSARARCCSSSAAWRESRDWRRDSHSAFTRSVRHSCSFVSRSFARRNSSNSFSKPCLSCKCFVDASSSCCVSTTSLRMVLSRAAETCFTSSWSCCCIEEASRSICSRSCRSMPRPVWPSLRSWRTRPKSNSEASRRAWLSARRFPVCANSLRAASFSCSNTATFAELSS
mmetsp:Transcript_21199/g.47669  ORF Transcript_21199/g.47669 Transcript_21199/m.47669 type:complete len:325 (+) Transcript_21199:114-1088(+)